MNVGFYNALILTGIIQGIIFSIWIFTSKKYANKSSFYLAGVILCFSLENLQFGLNEMNFINSSVLYNIIYVPWSILIPPFLLFYGITFLNPDSIIPKRLKWLYLPFVSMFILSSIYKIFIVIHFNNEFVQTILELIPWIGDTLGDFLNTLFFIVILVVLFIKIINYEKITNSLNRETIKVQLNWLKLTLLVLMILMLVWLIYTLEYVFDNDLVFYPLYLAASLTIYWLGYIGIYKIGINEERQKIRDFINLEAVPIKKVIVQSEQLSAFQNLIINERLFLDNNLNLDVVASLLNVSKGHLSRTINSELNTSFSMYINGFRVEEAKVYLSNPDFENYTLTAIGLEAGFNSKSTFYSTFKKFTGITPLQFKNNLSNESKMMS